MTILTREDSRQGRMMFERQAAAEATPTQLKVAAWQARQPAHTGKHDTRIAGKGVRAAAKKQLVRKAAQG